MLRNLIFVVFVILVKSSNFLYAEDKMLEENLKRHIQVLASQIGERNAFRYENLEKSAQYIKKEFENYGYPIEEQVYFIENKPYKNIIATKDAINKEIIVVCAHYDSFLDSPGADDNASGVAGLLELARLLSKEKLNKTFKFIAFVNEEPPFYLTQNMGSFQFVKKVKKNKLKIVAVICLESIGFYSDKENSQTYPPGLSLFYPKKADFIAFVSNLASKNLLKKIVKEFKKNSDFPVEYLFAPVSLVPAIGFSDHIFFWKFGYKAIMITDTAFYRNPYYHSRLDLPQTIDYVRLGKVIQGLYYVLLNLGKEN